MTNFFPSLKEKQLLLYLDKQLKTFFPDKNDNLEELAKIIARAYERVEFCFGKIKGKYFSDEKTVFFNHLNGDHYCMFLYFASKEAYLIKSESYYLKLSLLNKNLFSIDLFGHIEMPDIFLLVHPLGTIIGRAKFENYLVIYQNVTIGGVHKNDGVEYPSFGKGVILYSKTSVLGNTSISKNTIVAANTSLIGNDYPENSLIIGGYPNNIVKPNKSIVKNIFFN